MKAIFSFLALGFLAGQAAVAQNQPAPAVTRVVVTQQRIGSATPPSERADEETIRLAGQLGLSPEQTAQVRAAALKKAQAHQKMLRKYEEMHFMGQVPPGEGQAIEAEFEAQLKAICTLEQYAKREKMKARLRRISAQNDSLLQVKYDKEGGPK